MKTNTISRDGLPPIRYTGEIIGSRNNGSHNNSTRWSVWTIHRTQSGKLILQTVHVSQWEGERTQRSATVYQNAKALCEAVRRECPEEELGDLLEELFPDQWVETID